MVVGACYTVGGQIEVLKFSSDVRLLEVLGCTWGRAVESKEPNNLNYLLPVSQFPK